MNINNIIIVLLVLILIGLIYIITNGLVNNNNFNINSKNNKLNRNDNNNNKEIIKLIKEMNDKQSKDILWYIGHKYFNNIISNCNNEKVSKRDFFIENKNNMDLNNISGLQFYWERNFATGEGKIANFNTTKQ